MGEISETGDAKREYYTECPVCCNELEVWYDDEDGSVLRPEKNALACCEGHSVCIDCVRKLVRASPNRCGSRCVGFSYACPICRTSACVTRCHIGALITGSWENFERQFPNINMRWVSGFDQNDGTSTTTDSVDETTLLSDDTSDDSSDVVAMV